MKGKSKTYHIIWHLRNFETEYWPNDFIKGFTLKRNVTIREARHIFTKIFGIVLNTRDYYDYDDEYKEYNQELTDTLNEWLVGEHDDRTLMEYAGDCADKELGAMNIIPLIAYLEEKEII